MNITIVILLFLLLVSIVFILFLLFSRKSWQRQSGLQQQIEIEKLLRDKEGEFDGLRRSYEEEMPKAIKFAVEKALEGQRLKISGDILQRYCAFSENYSYDIRDAHPLFILFDWIVLVGESKDEITEVVFQEMKSGDGDFTKRIDNSFYYDNSKARTLRNSIL